MPHENSYPYGTFPFGRFLVQKWTSNAQIQKWTSSAQIFILFIFVPKLVLPKVVLQCVHDIQHVLVFRLIFHQYITLCNIAKVPKVTVPRHGLKSSTSEALLVHHCKVTHAAAVELYAKNNKARATTSQQDSTREVYITY